METHASAEPVRGIPESAPVPKGKGTPRRGNKQAKATEQQRPKQEGIERTGGKRKKQPISLRPTMEIYELSATMARQRGKDRSAQDHNAHALGLIVEAVSGPAVHGQFGTLTPEELDERAIPLYIALGGYLKRRGKLPAIFGEGSAQLGERAQPPSHWGRYNGGAPQLAQGTILELDNEAETAFSGGPGPS